MSVSTFLRGYREAQRRERARQLELASAGQKNLRARVQDKRGRAKEQLLGAKKHEAAMKEMARRKVCLVGVFCLYFSFCLQECELFKKMYVVLSLSRILIATFSFNCRMRTRVSLARSAWVEPLAMHNRPAKSLCRREARRQE